MALLNSTTMRNIRRLESRASKWACDALASPDLALKRGERMVERELERWFPTKESIFEALAKLYEQVDINQVDLTEVGISRFVGADPLALTFWEKIKEADRLHPSSPLLLIFEPTSFGQAKMRSLSALHTALTFEGTAEQKALSALSALGRIVDELYRPYLLTLERLGALLFGKKTRKTPTLGRLAERCSEWFDPRIVDRNLVRVRNAAAHGHFRYLGHRRMHLWNDSDEKWNLDVTTGEMLGLAESILNTVTSFEKATQLYALKFSFDRSRPALPHMVSLLRGQLSDVELTRINAEYAAGEEELNKARALVAKLGITGPPRFTRPRRDLVASTVR